MSITSQYRNSLISSLSFNKDGSLLAVGSGALRSRRDHCKSGMSPSVRKNGRAIPFKNGLPAVTFSADENAGCLGKLCFDNFLRMFDIARRQISLKEIRGHRSQNSWHCLLTKWQAMVCNRIARPRSQTVGCLHQQRSESIVHRSWGFCLFYCHFTGRSSAAQREC